MDVEQFKDDVREGRIDADRLVDLVVTLQRGLQQAKRRIEELEKKLGGSPTQKIVLTPAPSLRPRCYETPTTTGERSMTMIS